MNAENFINKVLALDPNAALFIKKLSQQTLEIQFTTLKKSLILTFLNNQIQIQDSCLQPCNVIIKGPIKAYLKLAISKDPHAAARLGLTLEGDPITLQTLQQFLAILNIDWEELISQWTGDIIAHKLGSLSRLLLKKQKAFFKSNSQMISDYLKEESKILPAIPEVDFFLNEVDEIQAATERLEARFQLLQEKM